MPKPSEEILDTIEVSEDEIKEQEGKFFVKDGQVFIREEEEEEVKTTSKDEEEKEEISTGKKKDDDDEEEEEEEEEIVEDDDLKGTIYEGKTAAQIAQMHKSALKDSKSTHTPAPISTGKPETKDAAYYETELEKVESKLDGMNKFDEGYDDLRKQQRTLSRRYMVESQKEMIETNVNAEKNVEFIEKKRTEYAGLEIEITPAEFDEVTAYSQRYMENGKLTDRSFTKGLIDKFGSEKVIKFFTVKGESDARRKIKEAGSKVKPKISTTTSKANAIKMRNISSMNEKELDDYLEGLSPAELAELYEKQTRRK